LVSPEANGDRNGAFVALPILQQVQLSELDDLSGFEQVQSAADAIESALEEAFMDTFHLEETFCELSSGDYQPLHFEGGAYSHSVGEAWDWELFAERASRAVEERDPPKTLSFCMKLVADIPYTVKKRLFVKVLEGIAGGDPDAMRSALVALYGPNFQEAALWAMEQSWSCAQPHVAQLIKSHAPIAEIAAFVARAVNNLAQTIDEWEALPPHSSLRIWQWIKGPLMGRAVGVGALAAAAFMERKWAQATKDCDPQNPGLFYKALLAASAGRWVGLPVGIGVALALQTPLGSLVDAAAAKVHDCVAKTFSKP
jgi:hypothetical protein